VLNLLFKRIGLSFIYFFLLLSCQHVAANIYQNYEVHKDSQGNLYLELPKQFVLIHSDVSIPLHVLPTNGLLRLIDNNGTWQVDVITEAYFNTLNLTPSDYVPEYIDFGNDGDIEVILRADSASDDSLILYGVQNGAVTFSVHQEDTDGVDLSQASQLIYRDENADGYLDIVNNTTKDVYLGNRTDKFVNYARKVSPTSSHVIGSTGGNFRVAEDGSATYQIPLKLPAGIAGVTPQVAFNYSSNAGDSTMGRGWSLSAVTAISRCPKNYAQDAIIQGVQLDITDQYCLNGQRLVHISGTHGANNAVYKTEIDSFNRITITRANTSGALAFKVETKAGETHYYGDQVATATGHAYVGNSVVPQAYLIASISDIKNNDIVYSYHSETGHQEVNLNTISWGATSHRNTLTVNYIKDSSDNYYHPRPRFGYSNGAAVGQTQLIDNVEISKEGEDVLRYKLVWDHGEVTTTNADDTVTTALVAENISRINAIQECHVEDTTESCLAPTNFVWSTAQTGTQPTKVCDTFYMRDIGYGHQEKVCTSHKYVDRVSSFQPFETNSIAPSGQPAVNMKSATQYLTGDLNHDGTSDVAYEKSGKWHVMVSTKTSTSISFNEIITSASINSNNVQYARVLDINSDGKVELVYPHADNWYKLIPSTTGSGSSLIGSYAGNEQQDTTFLDVNGDSYIDLVYRKDDTTEGLYVKYNQAGWLYATGELLVGAQKYTAHKPYIVEQSPNIKNTAFVDFNGDGISDLLSDGNAPKYTCTETHRRSVPHAPGGVLIDENILSTSFVRAEADAHCTTAREENESTEKTYSVSTSYVPAPILSIGFAKNEDGTIIGDYTDQKGIDFLEGITVEEDIRIVDFNGDGLSDILYIENAQWHYALSKGNSEFTLGSIPTNTLYASNQSIYQYHRFLDINNDGKTDLLNFNGAGFFAHITETSTNGNISFVSRGNAYNFAVANGGSFNVDDFNGDGKLDILYKTSSVYPQYHLAKDSNIKPNTIEHIDFGFGQRTSITYKPLQEANTGNVSSFYTSLLAQSHTANKRSLSDLDFTDNDFLSDYIQPNTKQWVVSHVGNSGYDSSTIFDSTPAPIKGLSVSYRYGGMLMHKYGRGGLGFAELETTDNQSGIVTTTLYEQEFPYVGMPISTTAKLGTLTLSTAVNTFAHTTSDDVYRPSIAKTTDKKNHYHSNNTVSFASHTVSEFDYDTSGNLTDSDVKQYANNTTTTTLKRTITDNEYITDNTGSASFTAAERGRLTKTTVKHYDENNTLTTLVSDFTYGTDGLLNSSTIVGLGLKTTYTYTAKGNKRTTCSDDIVNDAVNVNKRCSTVNWSSDERYVKSVTNALGQTESYLYNGKSADSITGRVWNKTTTNANGLFATQHFDIQGQPIKEVRADGTQTVITRSYTNSTNLANCTANSEHLCFYEKAESTSKPTAYTWYDAYGRKVKTQVKAFNNTQWSSQYFTFDELSRGKSTSIPYFENTANGLSDSTIDKTLFSYDVLGRVTAEMLAGSNGSNGITYNGATTQYTDAELKTRSEITNALGQLARVTTQSFTSYQSGSESTNTINTIDYKYNVFGKLTKVSNYSNRDSAKKSIIYNIYDDYGRKTDMYDPDKGHWEYTYNAFGELTEQLTGEGTNTKSHYDVLGRKYRSEMQAYNGYSAKVSCYTFGNNKSLRNVGQVTHVKQFETTNNHLTTLNCNATTDIAWQQSNTFDDLGRPKATSTTFDGATYTQSQTYDSSSRPVTQILPEGVTVTNHYTGSFLTRVSQNGYTLREINSRNAAGQVLTETIAEGIDRTNSFDDSTGRLASIDVEKANGTTMHHLSYTYDDVGNLTDRIHTYENNLYSIDEDFLYDDLHRLKNRDITYTGLTDELGDFEYDQVYRYDSFGNITQKYNRSGSSPVASSVHNYSYTWQTHADSTSTNPLHNYRLQSITKGTNSNFRNFTYDQNGNVKNDGQRSYDYTGFDKPYELTSSDGQYSKFWYGPSNSRYKREDHITENNESVDYTTHYSGAYERIAKTKNNITTIEHKYQIAGAVITRFEGSSEYKRLFAHKDAQGSVITISDGVGTVKEQFIYDPWGKRQKVAFAVSGTDSDILNMARGSVTTRGYTGHEEISHLSLIHMNGRVYDPTIGRFLQADPHVQAPNNSQNYNRYSYVLNNPMSYTDPSGYFFKKLKSFVKKYWRVIAAAVATYFTAGLASGWATGWAASMGLTTTGYVGSFAITTLSTTGSIFVGATAGAIAGAVGGYIATGSLKGALRGATSGAVFGAIGGYGIENTTGQIAAHAVAGGVLSDLQGGNFGHGFITAGLMKGIGKFAKQDTPARVLIQAVAGGTVSKLTGGKFGNGATTAALQFVVNELTSRRLQISIGIKKLTGALEAEYDTKKGFGAKFKSELKDGPVTVELDSEGQIKVMTGKKNQIGSTIDGAKYGLDGKIDTKVASFELSVKPDGGVLAVEWKVGISSGIFSGAYGQVHHYDMTQVPLFKNWSDYYGGATRRRDYICSSYGEHLRGC